MNADNYYWLFSTATQSIAALVAFMMAGVALAFSMMDGIVEKDETLKEIIDSLRQKYHIQLILLSITAFVAIVSSLIAISINQNDDCYRTFARIIAIASDTAIILFSMLFVVSITRPDKYRREAMKLIANFDKTISPKAELKARKIPKEESASVESPYQDIGEYIKKFIALEKSIREYLQKQDYFYEEEVLRQRIVNFGKMVDILYRHEKIGKRLQNVLVEVNQFRNLIVHGHVDKVSPNVMNLINKAQSMWDSERH
jgi:hypothetical protein